MPESSEVAGEQINNLVGPLQAAGEIFTSTLAQATSLEARAERLRRGAPGKLDRAIHRATSDLLALAESDPRSITDRELLEGVLQISQYKPSRVTWSGPADIPGILTKFDALSAGAPALIQTGFERFAGGIVTDHPVSVKASIEQGMGGLPKADITFGFQRVKEPYEAEQDTLGELEIITQSHRTFGSAVIGATTLQAWLDTRKFQSKSFTCGHGEHTNAANIEKIAHISAALIKIAGVELDTTRLDAVLREIISHRAYNDHIRQMRARSARHRPARFR